VSVCLCMVGSNVLGDVVARAVHISPEQVTVQVMRDDDIPPHMAMVRVFFIDWWNDFWTKGDRLVELVARAVVHDVQGKTVVLRVLEWDENLGCRLLSEQPTAH
jgi:hypothetical protein